MMKSIAKVESKVLTVLKKIDENISQEDIDVAHRLGKSKKKNPNIIVKFISRKNRNNIYEERKKLKNADAGKPTTQRVFINENLTKKNEQLFYLANDKRKRFGWKYIWTNNGRIHFRQTNESKVITIRHEKGLEQIQMPTADFGNLYGSSGFADSV